MGLLRWYGGKGNLFGCMAEKQAGREGHCGFALGRRDAEMCSLGRCNAKGAGWCSAQPLFSLFKQSKKAICYRRRDRSRACASAVRGFRFQSFRSHPAGGSGWRRRRHAITNPARPFGNAHGPMGQRFRERESVNKRTGPGMGQDGFRCMVWMRRSAVSAGWEICKQLHKQEKNA